MIKVTKDLEDLYGCGREINIDGLNGIIYGNDECFESNYFYQYFIAADTLYTAYYTVDHDTALDEIDYTAAIELKKHTTRKVEKWQQKYQQKVKAK